MENKTVSIVIRTIAGRKDLLNRAIASINSNDYPSKEIIIVYQGIDHKYFTEIKCLEFLYPDIKFKFFQNPTEKDERSKNANIGLSIAKGRYIGFLDDDDILLSNHISNLVKSLENLDNAWAYSQTARGVEKNGNLFAKDNFFFHTSFSLEKLWKGNYISMISFLIDTERVIDKSIIRFEENLTYGEDYIFILKLAMNYNPYCHPEITNICSTFTELNEHKIKNIIKSNRKIRHIKSIMLSESRVSFWMKELIKRINEDYRFLKDKIRRRKYYEA